MACSSLLVFFLFLAFTVSPTKSAEILTIYDSNMNNNNNGAASIAVSVSTQQLQEVANSVLMAETWLRNHVLMYYPSSNITHIVVAHNLLCSHNTHEQFHLNFILPAVKNLHYSLTRWGLHSEIRVSPSFSSDCFSSHHNSVVKPLLHFLKSSNSTYLINPIHEINPKFESLVNTHMEFVRKFGFLTLGKNKIKLVQNSEKPFTMRKLSYVEGPLPPLIGVGPITSPPSRPQTGQLPPLIGVGPNTSPPSPPQTGPTPTYPPHPHHNHHFHNLPPCNPWAGPRAPAVTTPPPAQHVAPGPTVSPSSGEKLWCVAKPSVPAETLQEAMDYACGEGGAECGEIQPSGSCYYPDTVVAHASYAFNSYWQKNKMNAGSCSFGGTAMIINSDPSFQQCRFTVT
ncbi:hypothetical protein RND81_02G135300 [Saponaria officinalis]|uniref:X8 domain-containing protein n=1 Tax=Saponaria officinalis TaxID=3572 RepID=A0AAW1MUY0_SAPOF